MRCTLSNYPPLLLLRRRPFEPRPLLPLTVAYIEGKGEHGFLLRHCIPLTIHSPLFHQFSLQENAFFLYSFFSPDREEVLSRRKEAGSGESNSFFPFLFIRDFLCSSLFFSSFVPCCEGTRSELSVLNPLLPRKSPLR